jgi:hypothetical protein
VLLDLDADGAQPLGDRRQQPAGPPAARGRVVDEQGAHRR